MTIHALKDFIFGCNYRSVFGTYDLKWTNRYRFNFEPSLNESIIHVLSPSLKGGIIVFSTAINAEAELSQHPRSLGILSFAERWVSSLHNRSNRLGKVDMAMTNMGITSTLSLGKLFKGRYRSQARSVYDERSLTLEILFLSEGELIRLATDLAEEFHLEDHLVRVNATDEVYYVDGTR